MARRPTSFSHQLWLAIFFMNVTMLLLLAWAFLYLEPGTPSYVIGQVSLVVVVGTIVASAVALFSGWTPF